MPDNPEPSTAKSVSGQVIGATAITGLLGAVVFNLDKVTPFLREFGLAVLVILFVLFFGAGCLWVLLRWVLPRADKLLDSTIDMQGAAIETGRKLVEQGNRQTEILNRVCDKQEHHDSILDQIKEAVLGCRIRSGELHGVTSSGPHSSDIPSLHSSASHSQ